MVATALAAFEPKTKFYSIDEYLDLEQQKKERHLFYNGKIVKMAGGTIAHNLIVANIIHELKKALDDNEDMYVFGSDQKIYLSNLNFFLYPDAVVVCNIPVISKKGHAITNPLLVVEVLSTSTQDYDQGQKFLYYQNAPSFREYVLVRQQSAHLTTFFREEPTLWRTNEAEGLEQSIYLNSLNISISLSRIYKKVL